MDYQKEYIQILESIYAERKLRNSSYSVMAFSRDAGFKSYHMSDILKGRYSLSYKKANDVAENLKMEDGVKNKFIFLTTVAHSRNQTEVEFAKKQLEKFSLAPDFYLDIETFDLISSWEYLAILELARRNDFVCTAEAVAQQLSISEDSAGAFLNKLIELDLIHPNSQVVNDKRMVYLLNQTKSESIRSYHKQSLEKAVEALENMETFERYAFTQNYSLTSDEYNEVSKRIHETVTEYFMEIQNTKPKQRDEVKDRLYCFTSCLFPLEQKAAQD